MDESGKDLRLKKRLVDRIQQEGDLQLLALIDRLLDRSKKNCLRGLLTKRTLRAEEDIAAGRVLSHKDAVAHVKSHIRKKKM